MDILFIALASIILTYLLAGPRQVKKSPGRPRKPKPFGKGMFNDVDGVDWWQPGNGGGL